MYMVNGPLIVSLVVIIIAIIFAIQSIKVVPQQTAWVIERLGKFHTVLNPGLNFISPLFKRNSA